MLDAGTGLKYVLIVPFIVILFLLIIMFIILITEGERRIPVQYAKRVVGRKLYGGQNTYIPIKVNMSGVMPIILAVSMVSVPSVIFRFAGAPEGKGFFGRDCAVYLYSVQPEPSGLRCAVFPADYNFCVFLRYHPV